MEGAAARLPAAGAGSGAATTPVRPASAEQENTSWAAERSDVVAAAIRALVPAGLEGMDYGCGPGHIGLRLVDHFATLSLVDASTEVVSTLQEQIEDQPTLRSFLLDLARPAVAEQVDCVFASMSLHHVRDTTALLDGFARVIRPGGWLLIADFDADNGELHSAEPWFDGHHGFEREALACQVRAHGFTTVHVADLWSGQRWSGNLLVDYSLFLLTARVPSAG